MTFLVAEAYSPGDLIGGFVLIGLIFLIYGALWLGAWLKERHSKGLD